MLNQSDSADFRVKVAVSKNNELIARHPRDELPYVCQYEGQCFRCQRRAVILFIYLFIMTVVQKYT